MPIDDIAAPLHAPPHSLGLELLVAASQCTDLERCHDLINQFLMRQRMPPADGPQQPPTALHASSDPHIQDILHQFLIEGTTEGIWLVDRDWQTTYANRALAQMLGCSPAEMLGLPIAHFMDEEGIQLAQALMARREQGIQETHEFQFVNRTGGKVWALVVTIPLLDRAGVFSGSVALVLDVTESKLAELTLLKQQALMQYAEQVGKIGSWEWDSEQRQITLSQGFLRIHGIEDVGAADIHDPWAFVVAEDRPNIQKLLEETKLGAGPFVVEHRSVRRNDGKICHLRTQGSALRDAAGKYLGFVGVSQDVTDRKQAEQELKESEERLRFALDATSEGVWDWNIQSGEVFFSDQWLRQLGYSRDNFTAHIDSWRNIVHPDDRPLVERTLQEYFDGHTVTYECENRLRTCSGPYRYNLDRGKVVEWSSEGKPLRMVGTDLDITQRKQAELAQAQLAAIVESSHDAIVGQDLEGRITSWNQGAECLYGYKAAEVIGEDVVSLLPAQGKPELQALFAQVRSGEPMKSIDTICIGKDGRVLDVSLTVSPVKDNKGIVIGISTSARDIADRKRIEAELRQSERQYRLLAENMLDVVWVMDVESGRFTYVSPSVERLRGYTVDEVLSQTALEAITRNRRQC
ncbi:MAG: PAS domain S-box protein [Anaerolineales bacterium]|nr:PAS domain S-box protein [Anaerolineales bacterium]